MKDSGEVDAVEACRGASPIEVEIKMRRVGELRWRLAIARFLLRCAERIGCFRLEFIQTIGVARGERRRRLRGGR